MGVIPYYLNPWQRPLEEASNMVLPQSSTSMDIGLLHSHQYPTNQSLVSELPTFDNANEQLTAPILVPNLSPTLNRRYWKDLRKWPWDIYCLWVCHTSANVSILDQCSRLRCTPMMSGSNRPVSIRNILGVTVYYVSKLFRSLNISIYDEWHFKLRCCTLRIDNRIWKFRGCKGCEISENIVAFCEISKQLLLAGFGIPLAISTEARIQTSLILGLFFITRCCFSWKK